VRIPPPQKKHPRKQTKKKGFQHNHLNDIEFLEKSIVDASVVQENGRDIKENIHFILIMPQMIEEAFYKPFAFFDLHFRSAI